MFVVDYFMIMEDNFGMNSSGGVVNFGFIFSWL